MSDEPEEPIADTIASRPEARSLGKVVISGTLWMMGGRVARVLTTIITLSVLARLISPAQFGVVATASLANAFVQTVMEGWLGLAVLRQRDLPKPAMQSQLWVTVLVALGLGLLTCAVAPLAERALHFPDLAWALIALTPVYLAHVYIAAATALMQRQYKFRAASIIPIACNLFGYAIPAVVMALWGWGMWALIWSQLLSLGSTAVILIIVARLPLGWPRTFEFRSLAKTSIGGALYRTLFWFSVNVDTMAVASTLGPAVTGLYTRAYNISVQVKNPFLSIQMTLRQALAAIEDQPKRVEDGLIRALRLAGLGSFIIAAFVVSTATPLTGVLLGPKWLGAAPILAAFFLGFPARVALLMLDSVSMALGQIWEMVLRQVGLVLFIAAAAFLAVRQGPALVALMVATTFWIGLLVSAFVVTTRAKISTWRILGALLPGLVVGLGLGGVLHEVVRLTPANVFLQSATSGAACGLVCVVLGLLAPDDWLGGFLGGARRRLLGALKVAR